MSRIVIQGGIPLQGEYVASGNKNAAIPVIIASLMIEGRSKLYNVPNTLDIFRVIEQIEQLGSQVSMKDNQVEVSIPKIAKMRFGNPEILAPQINLMIAASLLGLTEKIIIDNLDLTKERVDTHLQVLQAFEIKVQQEMNYVELSRESKITGKSVLLSEASVTATELALLLAVTADGDSRIYNAACEPHVQDLIEYLNRAGAKIEGSGTNLLLITGVKKLTGTEFTVSEDHIEIGSVIGMVAMTRGNALIHCTKKDRLQPILMQYKKLGVLVNEHKNGFFVNGAHQFEKNHEFIDNQSIIASSPWPNFPSDLISMCVVLATQAHGSILVHEKLYNSRMHFVDNLIYMGARIVQCDPHRVIVSGPTTLYPTEWDTPDVRTGLASLGAGVACSGKMIIDDVQIINRIFENIVGKLQSLGAQIGVG